MRLGFGRENFRQPGRGGGKRRYDEIVGTCRMLVEAIDSQGAVM